MMLDDDGEAMAPEAAEGAGAGVAQNQLLVSGYCPTLATTH